MRKQLIVRYSFDIPKPLLDKVRTLSNQRKIDNHENPTQRAIIIELIEIGLLMLEPSGGSQSVPPLTYPLPHD